MTAKMTPAGLAKLISFVDMFWDQTRAERQRLWDSQADPMMRAAIVDDFRYHATGPQTPPPGEWLTWLFLGGRGAGKTRAGAEWVRHRALRSVSRIALVGPTFNDVREVMIEGPSGLKNLGSAAEQPRYEASRKRLVFPSGSQAYAFSAEDADGLRGPQFDFAWGDAAIDAVAIDFYIPLADWRDGPDHLDAAIAAGPHDRAYLAAGVTGGEGWDWYYASPADREAQQRTAISDGTHNEPWVWRYKDLIGWWSNPHHDRPAGVRAAAPTAWVPRSKPIWLTELGCPAVDKGANQPNVFLDPKSAESRAPHYSSEARDDLIQRRYLEVLLAHWSDPAANPHSPLYDGPMVEPDWTAIWAFDARPWPDFPARSDLWSDGANWRLGHWLNGRAGLVPVARILDELVSGCELSELSDTQGVDDLLAGYRIDRPMPVRDAIAPLVELLGLQVGEGAVSLRFTSADTARAEMDLAVPVDRGADSVTRLYAAPMDLVRDVRLAFQDEGAAYQPGHAAARDSHGTVRDHTLAIPVTADADTAQRWCRDLLDTAHRQADRRSLVLPPSILALEVGDGLRLADGVWQVAGLAGDSVREARLVRPAMRSANRAGGQPGVGDALPAGPVRPALAVLDVPLQSGETRTGPWLAAAAQPWPGAVDVWLEGRRRARVETPARFGTLTAPLAAGLVGYWDRAACLDLALGEGALASATPLAVLAGANRLAVEATPGQWEVIGFANAELDGVGHYRLRQLLRGLGGSAGPAAPAGSRVVVLENLPPALALQPHERGAALTLQAVEAGLDPTGPDASVHTVPPPQADLVPLAPVHLRLALEGTGIRLDWIRQTRIDGDDWAAPDVPLGEASEAWQVVLEGDGVAAPPLIRSETGLSLDGAALSELFGARPAVLVAHVAQISARVGAGAVASVQCNL